MTTSLLLGLFAGAAFAGDAARGAILARVAGCEACHTTEGGAPLAGGPPLETRFGTFTGPNISPDHGHGIGSWSLEDFERAMRHGRSPEGTRYYPAFPYPFYTRITDADLADLFAWLQQLEPVATPSAPQDLKALYRGRWKLGFWKLLAFRARPFVPDPDRSAAWNRGAYLVTGPGHCGACHSPRGPLGKTRRRRALAGSREPPEPAPNITPHPDGIGDWSASDLVDFFETGLTPEGDVTGKGMRRVVEEGTSHLSPADRLAIATYLQDVPPRRSRPRPEKADEEENPWD